MAKSQPATAVVERVTKPVAPVVKKFKVHLAAHTPVAHNGVVIEANNPDEAKDKFCEMNGIGGSTCPWTITEVVNGN